MLLIGNGRLITRGAHNRLIENGCVAADGNVIAAVGTTEELKKRYPGAEFIDARGGMILPGLINAHNHIYSAYSRGIAINGYNPQNFLDILDGMWWTIDRNLLLGDTRMSALTTYIDCIKNGVTTVFDHHASYGEIPGSLFAIADAAKETGVRTCLCYEVSDRDGAGKDAPGREGERRFHRLLQKGQDRHGQGHDGPARLLHPLGCDARPLPREHPRGRGLPHPCGPRG